MRESERERERERRGRERVCVCVCISLPGLLKVLIKELVKHFHVSFLLEQDVIGKVLENFRDECKSSAHVIGNLSLH